ncbi:hypothetical protein GE061_003122 [Apolygus lucorum]|uniref:Uncharacterized protein n=2 Tax=Apolygus lucorum TaxID=248454 RepID=A0A6A4JQ45_APOLU|nr:hypothetical protein GE061_003122 [Apolygus lucorum]
MELLKDYGNSSSGVSGYLKTNGQPRDVNKFRKNSCYITQEDLLVPLLSLHELMCFAASLKLPTTFSGKQKRAVVEEVQTMLGISECRATRTEKLSGGQKKRLSVALELINNPPILFLDEPTSGLDNVSSINLLQLLRTLAHQGRTIVCTIHQPSASMFALFDHVFFLAAGQCVFQGATTELVPFLSNIGLSCPTTHNPADFIIELTEDDAVIQRLSDATANGKKTFFSKTPNKIDFDRNHRTSDIPLVELRRDADVNSAPLIFNYGRIHDEFSKEGGLCSDGTVSFWTQFYTLLSRMLLQTSRNQVALQLQFWNHFGCALMFGLMFYNMAKDGNEFFNHMKFCIGVILFHTYTQCMIPILSYPFHVKLLKKEHFNQWYRLFPYYTALTCSTIPTIAFFSMIFLTTVYALSGLPWQMERFSLFCFIGLTTAFIAEAMGLFIGAVFSVTNGTAVGPLTVAPFLGLAIYGFDFAREVSFFMNILVHTSFMRCGVVALIITVFGMNRGMLECSDPFYCHFQDPEVTLYYLDLEKSTPIPSLVNMFGIYAVFRTALYLGLKWRLRTG